MIRIATLLLTLMATTLAGAAPRVTGVTDADAKAIVALADAADDAWNRKSVEGMAAAFTPNGHNRILGTPVDLRGHEEMKSYFTAAFARRTGVMRHVTTVEEIELVAPATAVSDARVAVEQQNADGSWSVVRTFTATSVVVKEDGAWKIRTNRVRPDPAPAK
jgi:uncharacterized protein (TIGR02246 family)